LCAVVEKLSRIGINNVIVLVVALRKKGPWKEGLNSKLDDFGEKRFTEQTLNALLEQADELDRQLKSQPRFHTQQAPEPQPQLHQEPWLQPDREMQRERELNARPMSPQLTRSSSFGGDNDQISTSREACRAASDVDVSDDASRALAACHTDPTQEFCIVADSLNIHDKPALRSLVIGTKIQGEVLVAISERFDGWVELANGCGWVLREVLQSGRVKKVLKEVGPLPCRALVGPLLGLGPQKFKVAEWPPAMVFAEPVNTSEALEVREGGTDVFAEAQAFNGWVRLVDGRWMPAIDPEHGTVLICTSAQERQSQKAKLKKVEAALAEAEAQKERSTLQGAIASAKATGLKVWLTEFKQREARRMRLRGRINSAVGNSAELRACVNEASAAEFADEALLSKCLLRKLDHEHKRFAGEHEIFLEQIMTAAASGNLAAVKAARDAAKAAGVDKTAIARAYALGQTTKRETEIQGDAKHAKPLLDNLSCEAQVEPCDEQLSFEGCWVNEVGEYMATIRNKQLLFPGDVACTMHFSGDMAFAVEISAEEVFAAQLDARGRLIWDDGDVWLRQCGDSKSAHKP